MSNSTLVSQPILLPRELVIVQNNKSKDIIIRYVLLFAASISIIVVIAQIFFLFNEARPALPFLDFTGNTWDPTSTIPKYGIKPLIVGTLIVTITAMIFAIPIGVSVAIFISEIAPPKIKIVLKGIIEILAGIPSVIYGFFGMKVLTVFLQNVFNKSTGQSAFAGGILLSVMALPTIISVAEDAMSVVPTYYREASVGLGATKWQTISKIVVPSASSGITTAIILGMGRAIGETMAVLMVTGNSALIPTPITDLWTRVRTITANLGIEIPETPFGTTHYHMLFFTVILLFVIIIVLNLIAESVMTRMNERFNPELAATRKNNQKKIKEFIQTIRGQVVVLILAFLMGLLFNLRTAIILLILVGFIFSLNYIYRRILIKNSQKVGKVIKSRQNSFKSITRVFTKYRTVIIGISFQILFYLILQSWMPWWIAGLIVFGLSLILYLFNRLKPKYQQPLAFTFIGIIFAIVVVVLVILLGFIIVRGISQGIYDFKWVDGKIIQGPNGLGWKFLNSMPKDNLRGGGILPAILGTFYLIIGSILIALPIGIMAGIYLAEYAKPGIFSQIIRVFIDILNGTPSIVFGMFGFVVFLILPQNTKSLFAGQVTLALMILPTIIRTTEEAVRSINPALKEGSLALGATKWYTIRHVVLPIAAPGMITGIILGMGRSAGETAPIMFTAATALAFDTPKKLTQPVMILSYHLYYLLQHVPNSEFASNATGLVLLILVLIIYGGAMLIRARIKGKNRSDFFY